MQENNEQVQNEEVSSATVEDEQARADAVAAMAKSLGIDEDFNPEDAGIKDEEKAAQPDETEQLKMLMADSDGALFATSEMINTFESLMQQFGHRDFKINEQEKEQRIKAIAPAVQKYGGSVAGVFGEWKVEVFAALAAGSLAHGSLKQLKELKAIDKAKEVKPEPEETTETQPENATESAQAA